jgi:TolB-like protein
LVERAGQVVTREEIRKALWGNETFVDFDRGINFCVNQIRAALDDDPRNPRSVETLPRKGYRFIAPVAGMEASEDGAGIGTADSPHPVETSKPVPAPRPLWHRRRLLLAAAVAGTVPLATLSVYGLRAQFGPSQPIRSLAVLPLENLSHDPEQEYFAAGMTDELITALAKIGALRVVSRTSITLYRGTMKSLPEIARELNVDAVVEGAVLRAQNRVRITAQLIRAKPEEHLWAETYEGNLEEVLTLQHTVVVRNNDLRRYAASFTSPYS